MLSMEPGKEESGINIIMSLESESEVAQSCPILCDPMDYTVHGIL